MPALCELHVQRVLVVCYAFGQWTGVGSNPRPHLTRRNAVENPKDRLTPHMVKVLLTYAKLGSYEEAAESLNIKKSTLKNELTIIYRKLNANSAPKALYAFILENGDAVLKDFDASFG